MEMKVKKEMKSIPATMFVNYKERKAFCKEKII